MNRVEAAIKQMRPRVAALDEEKRAELDEGMALTFKEHFRYQTEQARAHLDGRITTDEALTIWRALGAGAGSTSNGGWPADVDLATKVVVTQVIAELLGVPVSR